MTKYQPPWGLRDWYKHYACDEHKHLIEDPDPRGIMEAAAKNPAPPQKVARVCDQRTEIRQCADTKENQGRKNICYPRGDDETNLQG